MKENISTHTIEHPSLGEGLVRLPQEFIDYTSSLFGEERWKNYLDSFEGDVPVSVRLNPFKAPLQLPRGGGLFDSNETLSGNPDNEKR